MYIYIRLQHYHSRNIRLATSVSQNCSSTFFTVRTKMRAAQEYRERGSGALGEAGTPRGGGGGGGGGKHLSHPFLRGKGGGGEEKHLPNVKFRFGSNSSANSLQRMILNGLTILRFKQSLNSMFKLEQNPSISKLHTPRNVPERLSIKKCPSTRIPPPPALPSHHFGVLVSSSSSYFSKLRFSCPPLFLVMISLQSDCSEKTLLTLKVLSELLFINFVFFFSVVACYRT